MKEVLNFINNNAIAASLITLAISIIVQIIFRRNDRKYSEKEKRTQLFYKKAELHIEDRQCNLKEKPDICLFMTDFKVDVKSENVKFYYNKNILKPDKYKHMRFYLKNIGEADINELDICSNNQRELALCDVDSLQFMVARSGVEYSYLYDRKIPKGDTILIDIAYLENSKIYGWFSSELALLYRDSYNNLYKQPFFVHKNNLYEPYPISSDGYKIFTTTDTAYKCFKNPWLW